MAFKSWTLATVTPSTDTDLAQPASLYTVVGFSLTIANYSGSPSTVKVLLTNSSNTLKAYVLAPISLTDGQTLTIDSSWVLTSQDKIRVNSSQGNVSFLANGDERL